MDKKREKKQRLINQKKTNNFWKLEVKKKINY